MHEVGLHIEAGLAAAGAADHQYILVPVSYTHLRVVAYFLDSFKQKLIYNGCADKVRRADVYKRQAFTSSRV